MRDDVPRLADAPEDVYDQFVRVFADIPTRQQWETLTGLLMRMSDRQQDLVVSFLVDWLTPKMRRRIAVSGEVPKHWAVVFDVALGEITVPADVAAFYRLLAVWLSMWNGTSRYGPAGVKIQRGLIVLLGLIIVTFVLDVAVAQAHLTEQQAINLTVVEGAVAVGLAAVKK